MWILYIFWTLIYMYFYLNANNALCFMIKHQSLAYCILIIKSKPRRRIKNSLVLEVIIPEKKNIHKGKTQMPNYSGSLEEGHLNPPWSFREGFFKDITTGNKSSKSHSNQLGIVVIGWLWWEWEGGTRAFQADWQNEKSHMHEKKPIVWVTFISCRCESSTWEAGKGGWMPQ